MSITRQLSFANTTVSALLATTLVAGLAGCSSGGDGIATTSVSGSVFAAPVSGASCEIQDSSGTTIIGAITTSASGSYSVNIPNANLTDDLMLVCSGGTYTDEADGSSQTAGALAAYVAGGTLGSGSGARIHATPESTIIHELVTLHGKTLADANTAFNAAFGYTPDTAVAPTDATSPVAGATNAQLLAGLRAAAFSQLTIDLSLNAEQQFALLTALARDISDGTLDGMDTSGAITITGTTSDLPVDIQSRFGTALLKFRAGNDATGLDSDEIGALPFAKTALTSTYKVEYIPGMMTAMQGKTQFKIRLTRRDNDMAESGATVTLMPMMHMATMMHATPTDGACTESSTAGDYDCSIYYLMASTMANGMSMGYWDLKVMIGGEMAHFYPPVMMAMGDTARADLKGVVDDEIMSMTGGTEKRRYHLFKSSLTGMTGNHDFSVFIAARESMMSFPALVDTLVLNTGTMYELTATTILVEMSTDLSSWCTATDVGNGYWSCSGLSGLMNDIEGAVFVRLSISGEQKTTNGMAADNSNEYATFTVTPGMSM